ncbi:MAG TPA: alanine racemase [Tissierellaceae bacterium]|nr:alanine racemase [Tissierellaceae bacterium]
MEFNKHKGTRVEIDLDNLAFNIEQINNLINEGTKIMAVVKANGYGHGAIDTSKVFLENGADRLGVSLYQEAMELRKSDIKAPILIFNYVPEDKYKKVIENNLTLTIYNYEDALALSNKAEKMDKKVRVHLKVDTGMGRIGFLPNQKEIEKVIKISRLNYLEIEGIYSHFAAADESNKSFVKKQYDRFNWFIKKLNNNNIEIPIKHISNSAGIIDHPEYNLDMVRPGIILYGYYPSDYVNKADISLKPAMTLKTNISFLKTLPKNASIGYNRTFITDKESRIATLPIGYADGYYRVLSGKGEVFINGEKAPIVGSICMDQLMVDVTNIQDTNRLDEVVLFGYENNKYPRVEEISKLLGTSHYEVISIIGRRVPRIYLKGKICNHKVNYV